MWSPLHRVLLQFRGADATSSLWYFCILTWKMENFFFFFLKKIIIIKWLEKHLSLRANWQFFFWRIGILLIILIFLFFYKNYLKLKWIILLWIILLYHWCNRIINISFFFPIDFFQWVRSLFICDLSITLNIYIYIFINYNIFLVIDYVLVWDDK